jgi:hypothetical protein
MMTAVSGAASKRLELITLKPCFKGVRSLSFFVVSVWLKQRVDPFDDAND